MNFIFYIAKQTISRVLTTQINRFSLKKILEYRDQLNGVFYTSSHTHSYTHVIYFNVIFDYFIKNFEF